VQLEGGVEMIRHQAMMPEACQQKEICHT
jgi:hypothetical protein